MKKVLLAVLSVGLFPVVVSAQYQGYSPVYHNSDNYEKSAEKLENGIKNVGKVVGKVLKKGAEFHTTSGAGYVPPVSKTSLSDKKGNTTCEMCETNVPHIHTTGGAAYFPPLPASFGSALDRANAASAQKHQETQENQENKPVQAGYRDPLEGYRAPLAGYRDPLEGFRFMDPEQQYGYCQGIYEAAAETPQEIHSKLGFAALLLCSDRMEKASAEAKSCPTPEVTEKSKKEAKNWWQKNVVDNYVEGYRNMAKSYMMQAESAHETTEKIRQFCRTHIADAYVEGYRDMAESYIIQSHASHKTVQEVAGWCKTHIVGNYVEGYNDVAKSYMMQSEASHQTLQDLGKLAKLLLAKCKQFYKNVCGR